MRVAFKVAGYELLRDKHCKTEEMKEGRLSPQGDTVHADLPDVYLHKLAVRGEFNTCCASLNAVWVFTAG